MKRDKSSVLIDFGDWDITKRELGFSVTIIAIMLIIGFLISNNINNSITDKNLKYEQAIHIKDSGVFKHGMDTDVGNAFVHGKLKSVDTVTYKEIKGNYAYIQKVREEYTRHTRTVTYTTGTGKNKRTHTKTEVYYTWDEVSSDSKKCKEIKFCGVKFDSNKIKFPASKHIDTIKKNSEVRYQYYGVKLNHKGTIYADLRNGTIPSKTKFYDGMSIDETLESLESDGSLFVFWIAWIILIIALVVGFYYLDNRWLE